MKIKKDLIDIEELILNHKNILFVQDIDGVCIPLVKDPMQRELEKRFIYSAKKLNKEFFVLTCGEHEGKRGVNRIIERSLKSRLIPKEKGLYLRGLGACGVEYQNNFGEVKFDGITEEELNFLSKVPKIMEPKFKKIVNDLFPEMDNDEIEKHIRKSICDTKFSPTINFNSLFELVGGDLLKRKRIQIKFQNMMNEIISEANSSGLNNTFFLHISPNLGTKDGIEIIKKATINDIGSTDIQLILKGALKDSGVLYLLNQFIGDLTGEKPFGSDFNIRNSPISLKDKISFCRKFIEPKDMPLIIGVGDTITSNKINKNNYYSRGGSDRSFLELIQALGVEYGIKNNIIFVDSSSGEVNRPSTQKNGFLGITDEEDFLKFDIVFHNGPKEYINWFSKIADKRFEIKNKYK
tara:strand:- start:2314 stop:3537 length:1224 start_codon:yes stop_codon:yes gene_type:complete